MEVQIMDIKDTTKKYILLPESKLLQKRNNLTAEQVEDFKNHFKALIRFDKSMLRWNEPLDYAFDVPEKKL